MQAREIRIDGIVQGVGFRPFVARTARAMNVRGEVRNSIEGVRIHAEHEDAATLDAFEQRLQDDAPPASRIVAFESRSADPTGCEGFSIEHSEHDGSASTLVSPDLATCPACLAELFDESDRRYHYPFINCTNCGPRFTIIDELPYDRPTTSMKGFAMCPECAAEYADDVDRRYHAQPDACFECGPRLWWWNETYRFMDFDEAGSLLLEKRHITREESDAIIAHAASRLAAGDVVAVKGLGGWHLACDAANHDAVQALRDRKHRPTKPLALMAADLDAARAVVEVSDAEAQLMESPARPIVLCRRKEGAAVATNIAGDLPELGVMLPSTPVQHLLLRAVGGLLVMTSGNISGEPIVASDEQASSALGHIADGFLGNNRAIVARYDDSVARIVDGHAQFMRRARGYAPAPLQLPAAASGNAPVIFAAGPEQKSTFAYLRGTQAFVSQHLGDLETAGAWAAWQEARERYGALFGIEPEALACDLHPEYLASKWARDEAASSNLPLIEVQHHHAHIASVLGENAIAGPVIGVAADGTGYGSDGTIWGCELLVADRARYERIWHLPAFALPGGAAAVREPLRVAWALAHAGWEPLRALDFENLDFNTLENSLKGRLGGHELLTQMMDKQLNSPLCSSAGRLFDAVSALLGICEHPGYEGEAACLLEAAARREPQRSAQLNAGDPLTASLFHRHFAATIINACEEARRDTGIGGVALSGGCMANRILAQGLREGLQDSGFTVYENRELPPGDGCISYGQAVVAQARFLEG